MGFGPDPFFDTNTDKCQALISSGRQKYSQVNLRSLRQLHHSHAWAMQSLSQHWNSWSGWAVINQCLYILYYQPYCSPTLTQNSNEPVNTATLHIYKRKRHRPSYDISGRILWQRKVKTFTGKQDCMKKKKRFACVAIIERFWFWNSPTKEIPIQISFSFLSVYREHPCWLMDWDMYCRLQICP